MTTLVVDCHKRYHHATDSVNSFSDLPVELQLKVFSYLTREELCGVVALVCKTWWALTRDPSLWRKLSIYYPYFYEAHNYEKLLRNCTQLRVLSARAAWHCFPREISSTWSCFPMLKELHLSDFIIREDNVFRPLRVNCRHLETVCMVSCGIYSRLRPVIFDIASLPRLKSFTFVQPVTRSPNDSCLKIIATKRKSTLRELNVEGANLTDAGILSLEKCTNLESVHISKALRLTKCSIDALKNLRLKSFKFNYPFSLINESPNDHISSQDLANFLCASERECLLELGLQGVNLDGSGLTSLLNHSIKLQELSLRNCWRLTDEDVMNLLRARPSLNLLDLSGCTSLSPDVLVNIPKFIPRLERLELSSLTVTNDNFLKKMKPELPHLELEQWGEICVFSKDLTGAANLRTCLH